MSSIQSSRNMALLGAIILLIIVPTASKGYAAWMVNQSSAKAGSSSVLFGDEFAGTELDRAKWDVFRGNPVVKDGWLTLTDADVESQATFSCGDLQGVIQSSDWRPHDQFTDSSFGFEMWTGANGQCHYGALLKASGHLAMLRPQPDINGDCSGDPLYQAYPAISNWDVVRASSTILFTISWRSGIVTATVSGNGQAGEASYVGQAVPNVPLKIRLYANSSETYQVDYMRLSGCHVIYLPISMRQFMVDSTLTNMPTLTDTPMHVLKELATLATTASR